MARTATAKLHRSTTTGLDTDDMLRRLHRSRTRRTRTVAAAAALVVLVAGSVAGLALDADGGRRAAPGPAHSADDRDPGGRDCGPHAVCLGGRRLRLELERPVVVEVPRSFTLYADVFGRFASLYRRNHFGAGAAVYQDAVPVAYAPGWRRDPAAGTTARSMARWLSERPYLVHAQVVRRTVDGVEAWQVTGDLESGAELPAIRDGKPFAPAFRAGRGKTGWAPTVRSAYTLVDQPGGGVSVIWSVSWGQTQPDLTENQPGVDALVVAVGRS